MKRAAAIVLLSLGACSQAPTGNASLGITEFSTSETPTELHIVGYGANHTVIGEAVLRLGHVTIVEEDLDGDGRELTVEVRGEQAQHQSLGTAPVTLPPVSMKGALLINDFLRDPHVAAPLAKWGVTLLDEHEAAALQKPADVPYDTCVHALNSSCTDVTPNPDTSDCCGWNSDTSQVTICDKTSVVVQRQCSSTCTSGCSGSNSCGPIGGLGCSVCWSTVYTNSGTTSVSANSHSPATCDAYVDGSLVVGPCYCDVYYRGMDFCDTPVYGQYMGTMNWDQCLQNAGGTGNGCGCDWVEPSCVQNCSQTAN